MLTAKQKARIKELYALDPRRWNITALSMQYKVSRTAVGYILFPERDERNKKLRKERNDSKSK